MADLTKSQLLVAILALGFAPYALPQTRPPAVSIETKGSNTIVSVAAPRPLYQGVIALSRRYGWIVDYEDPVYSPQESRDVTAPEWRRNHPNEQGLFIPSGTTFTANLGDIDKKSPDEAELLGKLVEQYNESGNPGYFRVIHILGHHFVISGRSRAEVGSSFEGVLDSLFRPARKPEDAATALEQITKQCSASGGVPIKLGLVPGNATGTTVTPNTKADISCRAGVDHVIQSMSAAVIYVLLYDIGERAYFLSILPAQKITTGANGKAAKVPLQKPSS